MNKQTIDLDVITGGVPQVLHVAQYDTGARTLEFNIYSSNNDLDLTGATAKISGRKADGLGFEYPATISDGVVVADCTDQMTAVAGIVECAITLTNSEGQIQTARFDLNVKPAPLNDDTVISDSDFPLIEQAIEAEGKAEEAEAWAVGTRNGEPVPVSDPTYENNAKYWAKQAEQTDIGQVNKEIADIVKANGVLGAKNLIPYPYYETTKTASGITFTDNGDGTITANGTATGRAVFYCRYRDKLKLKAGRYTLSGFPVMALADTTDVQLEVGYVDANNKWHFLGKIGDNTTVDPITITITDTISQYLIEIDIVVRVNKVVSNLTFKPMLRLAEDTDDTYQPYAMTNYELTQKIADLQAQINALI